MTNAWEVITGRLLNPGAALVALGANTGDTFTVRNFDLSQKAWLEGIWAQSATAGQVRLRAANMHDPVNGLLFDVPAAVIRDFLGDDMANPLIPQSVLTFEIAGGAAETDSAALMVYYENLPGPSDTMLTWDQVKPRIDQYTTTRIGVAGPVTAGDWSPGTALSGGSGVLDANTPYAVLGYVSNTACNAVALRGTDTANLRVGGPGPLEPLETRDWFIRQSVRTGRPHIPVINSANLGNILAFVALNTAAGTVQVDFILARLTK